MYFICIWLIYADVGLKKTISSNETRINGRLDTFDRPIKGVEGRFDLGYVAIYLIQKVNIFLKGFVGLPQGLSIGALQGQLRIGNSVLTSSKFTFEPIEQRGWPVGDPKDLFWNTTIPWKNKKL